MKDLLRSVFGMGAGKAVEPSAPQAPVSPEAGSVPQAPPAPAAPEAPGASSLPIPPAAGSAVDQATQEGGLGGGLGGVLGGILGGGGANVGGAGGAGGGAMGGLGGVGGLMALLPTLLSVLGARNGGQSGFESLLGGLHANGLSHLADSWVGTGPNQAISADQVVQSLGPDTVNQVAQQAGVPTEVASQGLASILPGLVDHLTPGGQMPDAAGLDQALANLRRQVPVG